MPTADGTLTIDATSEPALPAFVSEAKKNVRISHFPLTLQSISSLENFRTSEHLYRLVAGLDPNTFQRSWLQLKVERSSLKRFLTSRRNITSMGWISSEYRRLFLFSQYVLKNYYPVGNTLARRAMLRTLFLLMTRTTSSNSSRS